MCGAVLAVVVLVGGVLSADPGAADEAASDLRRALDLYSQLQFTDAMAVLADLDRDALTDDDQLLLDRYLRWTEIACHRQAGARQLLADGDQALADGDLATARDCYADAAACEFLDPSHRQQARERLAGVEGSLAGAAAGLKVSGSAIVAADAPAENDATDNTNWDGRPVFEVVGMGDASSEDIILADAASPVAEGEDVLVLSADGEDQAGAAAPEVTSEVGPMANDGMDASGDETHTMAEVGGVDLAEVQTSTQSEDVESAGAVLDDAADDTVRPTEGSDALTRLDRERRLAAQQAGVDFDQNIRHARERLAVQEFDAAEEAALTARDVLDKRKSFLTPEDYGSRLKQVEALILLINSDRTKWEIVETERKREELEEQERVRQRLLAEQRRRKIATLEERAKNLVDDHEYEKSLEIVREIMKLDPQNPFATAQMGLLEQFVLLRKQDEVLTTIEREQAASLIDIRVTEIPWNELLTYPSDWKEITHRRREMFGQVEAIGSEEDRMAYLSLKKRVGQLDFDEIRFTDVVQYLRDVTGAGIHVKWNALMPVGVNRDTPVTLHLPDRTLEQVLKLLLEDLGDVNPLAYTVENGVIKISTQDDLRTNVITRVYDIQDLIFPVPDFVGPRVDVAEALGDSGEDAGGGFLAELEEGDAEPTRAEMIEELEDAIRSNIDATSWTGGEANIQESRGQFIITQTPENHLKIQKLLDNMRATRAIQIAIESRFVEVTTGWLERVGVDLDIVLNAGGASGSLREINSDGDAISPPPFWSRGNPGTGAIIGTSPNNFIGDTVVDPMTGLGVMRHPGTTGWTSQLTPVRIDGGSKIGWTSVSTGRAGDIGGATDPLPTALQIAGAFMDDVEVSFLVEATQGSSTARTLTAPRLTLYNGQRAYVTVATQTAYVKGWEPLVAEGSAALRPIVGFIPTGTVMDVEATVSADRRYVTMTIRPQEAQIGQTPPRSIQFAVGSGIGVATIAEIELPEVALKDLQTTVSVPDGGTLLLGGQKLSGQVEREVGPPVLSKVPVLNRFFTARGSTRDEQTLLILVKPRIIIQQDYETAAFP